MNVKINEKKLPEDIKTEWLKALRSGEYEQGSYLLYNTDTNTYCCLGVLGKICGYSNEVLANQTILLKNYFMSVPSVIKGTATDNLVVQKLTEMNDIQGKSFIDISNWIEENL